MKILLSLFIGVFLLSCSASQTDLKGDIEYVTAETKILSVDKPEFVSGYIESWVELKTSIDNSDPEIYYIQYFNVTQNFPKVGDLCIIKASKKMIVGVTLNGNVPDNRYVFVPKLITCGKEKYSF